jgi:hypothetical protein
MRLVFLILKPAHYGYDQPKTIAVHLLNESFEITSSRGVLQPINLTCSKTNLRRSR